MDLFTLFALGSLALMALIVVELALAIRHDQVVRNAGPQQQHAALIAQVDAKRQELVDIDEKLAERTAALRDFAERQAEVDALMRQRDELLSEYQMLDERRQEIRELDRETEAAITKHAETARLLLEKEEALSTIQHKIDRADELIKELDQLEDNKKALTSEVESLRQETSDLRRLEADAETVRATTEELRREMARLEASAEHLQERRSAALAAAEATETDLAAKLLQQSEAQAAAAASAETLRQLEEQRAPLEARLAVLQRAAEQAAKQQEQLEQDRIALADEVDRLRAEANELHRSQTDADSLQAKSEALQREITRLETSAEHLEERRSSALAATESAETDLARTREEQFKTSAAAAAAAESLRQLEEQRAPLEARLAYLQRESARARGQDSDGDGLAVLQAPPVFLSYLQKLPKRAKETEAKALQRVEERMQRLGLTYPSRTLSAFHTAMKVNETTQLTVLAGISGTGKSQLPRQWASAMGIGFLQVPVQPRWDSSQDLMGFYNYIESRFRPTEMARALYHLDQFHCPAESQDLSDRMLVILLDEMNLARVEYYFSDFLSRLESRPPRSAIDDPALRKDAEVELEVPMPNHQSAPRIFPGYNVLFAGTMNEDESTQTLSDKVIDRANLLRFSAPKRIAPETLPAEAAVQKALSRTDWESWQKEVRSLPNAEQKRLHEYIDSMAALMTALRRPIGHRLGRAMMSYAANYPAVSKAFDMRTPLADQVEMRLLPKLRGVEVEDLSTAFDDLARFTGDDLGDEVLAEAIRTSVDAARDGIGQFVWQGVIRS
jgi:hypothetical protein